MKVATRQMDKRLRQVNNQASAQRVHLESEVMRLRRLVQEQSIMIEDLQRRATEDGLTGLINRRGFDVALDKAMSDYHRYGRKGALLVIDLNGFKEINDTYGHQAGDAILCNVADVLTRFLRDSDVVARPGGDEFTIILRENSPEAARAKAIELEELIAHSPCRYEGNHLAVTASIGVCSFVEADRTVDVIAKADAEMYRRKAEKKALKVMSS